MNDLLKRSLDLAVAIPLLILLGPLMLLLALAIRIESPGNPVFIQERIGRHGRHYRMYKFRSMVKGAELSGTGLFSYEDDPRITRVGRLIRATSLDELPQLLNVVRGEMSMVGPRPPVTYELGPYEDFSDAMKARFVVRPGITGLAQVNGRNDLSWDKKLEMDLLYLQRFRRWGVLYDLVILARTAATVLSGKNVVEERR